MKSPNYVIQALGCKVSQYDAGRLEATLVDLGLTRAGEDLVPNLYILHSCSVTGRASQKTRQMLHSARRRWPGVKILLAGCEAKLRQKDGEETLDADAVLLPTWTDADLMAALTELGLPLSHVYASKAISDVPHSSDGPESRTRAFLKIQDGCEQFCTYCIVPHLRGKERSRPLAEVLAEARQLANSGFKEIVLTGIHLGRYAFGLDRLLQELDGFPALQRVRLSSIDPHEFGDSLEDWLERSPQACRHLHLPLQSGCDDTLQRMNRPYDTAMYARLVERLRKRFPGLGISTDLMVGFPGETDRHFAQTLLFVEAMQFSRVHLFRYSKRKGTPAADFPDQVPNGEKKRRADQVEALARDMSLGFHQSFLEKEVEVLWETRDGPFWTGFAREYIPCRAESSEPLANTITRFHPETADPAGLLGKTK